jgi:hypothetical protein
MKYLPVMSILGAPIEMKKFVKKGKRLGWRRREKKARTMHPAMEAGTFSPID